MFNGKFVSYAVTMHGDRTAADVTFDPETKKFPFWI